jgi:hypothetical protein
MTMSEYVRSSPGVGVVKSLELTDSGPVVLVSTHKSGIQYKKPSLGRRPIHVCFRESCGHRISSASGPFITPTRTFVD